MQIDALQTPCVLIEQHRLEANIRRMQERADSAGVALRPHIKTHKSTRIASMQRAAGARGFTVATIAEAEALARAGFGDICIAYTVAGSRTLDRIAALSRRVRVSFCVDTPEGVDAAAAAFDSDAPGRVLIEVDTGHHRTGVNWQREEVVALARRITEEPTLKLVGLLTHAGHAYHGPTPSETPIEALERVAREERDRICHAVDTLRDSGLADTGEFTVSIGSTPTISALPKPRCVTEIRPGNYVFHDAMQVALGSADLSECALTVLSTVVSKHREADGSERIFVDAGKKVLTTDTGYGTRGHGIILYNPRTMVPHPHAMITGLSEEHGWVRVRGGSTLGVGDHVRIVPNHACVVVATQTVLRLVHDDTVIEELPVDAR